MPGVIFLNLTAKLTATGLIKGFLENLLAHYPRGIRTVTSVTAHDGDHWYKTHQFPSLTSFMWFQLDEAILNRNPLRACLTCGRTFPAKPSHKKRCSETCRRRAAGRTRDRKRADQKKIHRRELVPQ